MGGEGGEERGKENREGKGKRKRKRERRERGVSPLKHKNLTPPMDSWRTRIRVYFIHELSSVYVVLVYRPTWRN
jgi:hypothetical protein